MGQGLHAEIEVNKSAAEQGIADNAAGIAGNKTNIQKNTADIQVVSTAVAEVNKAVSDLGTDLRAQIGNNTAAISEKLTAMVDSDGSSSIYTLKVGVKYNGQEVLAGMSIAAIAQPGKPPTARVAFNAEEFALLSGSGNTLFSPFAVKGGQTFINDAFIQDGTITSAKIGDFIQSTAYDGITQGWHLGKDGTFINLGSTSGQGGMKTTQNNITVRDENNTVRVQIGLITGVW
ncbi:DUF1983 domain-containing protein [Kluyvera sichuanensis]|uniref:phage tail tip fiber protein n=1 Tax=Kluyvera sichuanensis TaxID=2725494 RepID=UPI0039F66351